MTLCLRIVNHMIHCFELLPLLFREFLCLLLRCSGSGLFGGRSPRGAPNVGILQDLEGGVLLTRGGRRALVQHEQSRLESHFLTRIWRGRLLPFTRLRCVLLAHFLSSTLAFFILIKESNLNL